VKIGNPFPCDIGAFVICTPTKGGKAMMSKKSWMLIGIVRGICTTTGMHLGDGKKHMAATA